MKRFTLAVGVAVLALAMGLSSVAIAADPAAATSAKKGKKKGKKNPCKAKRGKAKKKDKPKAKRSATASAKKGKKGRKGRKGKKKPCKPRGKKPGAKKPAPKGPEGPAGPPPAGDWPLSDGEYTDAAGKIGLKVSGGGTMATFVLHSDSRTCIPVSINSEPTPAISNSLMFSSGGTIDASLFTAKWTIAVSPDLSYKAVVSSSTKPSDFLEPCDKPGVELTGKLAKQ